MEERDRLDRISHRIISAISAVKKEVGKAS